MTIFALGGAISAASAIVGDKILDFKVNKVMGKSNKTKSLNVQKLKGKMDSSFLKGSFRNSFKNFSKEEVAKLIKDVYSIYRYNVISSGISSTLSCWI